MSQEPEVEQEQVAKKIILIVAHDEVTGSFLLQFLSEKTAFQPILVRDIEQVLQTIETTKPSLFILDYDLPSSDGFALYDQLHAVQGLEEAPTIMMCASYPPTHKIGNRKFVLLGKPPDQDDLLFFVERLLA